MVCGVRFKVKKTKNPATGFPEAGLIFKLYFELLALGF
jgi:hypothetical protein